ncbi:hypothetical protein [Natronococcus amylolyticus]|nr:hypothetical protein [Natronococcus amylolyticus]
MSGLYRSVRNRDQCRSAVFYRFDGNRVIVTRTLADENGTLILEPER